MAELTSPENEIHTEQGEMFRQPVRKSLNDILATDADDDSLKRYKKQLLGTISGDSLVVEQNNPNNVIVRNLTLLVADRPDVTFDLSNLSERTFIIKEGCHYRLRIDFHVQREIVSGLNYVQKVTRAGLQVDKDEFMVGSYPPKLKMHSFTTPIEEAPHGLMHRGKYKIKSTFSDDDHHEWLTWEWNLEIKKEWDNCQ